MTVVPAVGQLLPAGDPPFIATPETLVREMLRLGGVQPDELVVDLGSGDGRLVIAAGLAGARGLGVEYDRDLVAQSQQSARAAGLANRVRFLHQDIFQTDVSGADVVMLYLSAEFNRRLRPRLLDQLEPGSRVVSHAFPMGDWMPDSTLTLGSGAARATLFLWVIPADVDGFWSLELDGEVPLNLEFRQRYQQLSGTVWRGPSVTPVHSGRLSGRQVHFNLAGLPGAPGNQTFAFKGVLADGRITGTVSPIGNQAQVRTWTAYRFSDPSRPVTPLQGASAPR